MKVRASVGTPRCPVDREGHDWLEISDTLCVCHRCGAALDRVQGYLPPQAKKAGLRPRLVALVIVAALLCEDPREALAFLWCIVAHPTWLYHQGTHARIAWCPQCNRMMVLE